jgi:virginiamycin B lyase
MAGANVFVSHSHQDGAFTHRLVADLQQAGATVWVDVAGVGAGDFQKRINDALSACDWVVIVLTPDALTSTWVEQEVNAAIRLKHQGRIRDVIPIQAGPVDHRTLPPLWGVFNIFDATRDYRGAVSSLLRAIGLPAAGVQEVAGSPSPTGPYGQPVAPSQAPEALPPVQESRQSIPAPVSEPVAISEAPVTAAASVTVQEEPLVQEEPPAQVEQERAGLRRFWRPLVAILVVALVVGPFGVLISKGLLFGPSLTEYPVHSSDSYPAGIASGPDGALWFTELDAGQIGRITTSGVVTEYPISSPSDSQSFPAGIASGPDGALWFTERGAGKIGRITTSGVVTEYPIPTPSDIHSHPEGIASGSDGALWFVDAGVGKIGRITTSGVITEYPIPPPSLGTLYVGPDLEGIASGPDGALWFAESIEHKIGRITTSGVVTEYPIPTPSDSQSFPAGITRGPDGALWFTDEGVDQIGRITSAGVVTMYPIRSTASGVSAGIASGPDGALWFTEVGNIGRITTGGNVTEYSIPSLPDNSSLSADGITRGPDGAMWFDEGFRDQIGRITTGLAL